MMNPSDPVPQHPTPYKMDQPAPAASAEDNLPVLLPFNPPLNRDGSQTPAQEPNEQQP